MPNWIEIQKEWETSDITFKDLAEKHGVKDSTIRSRKNREKWQRNATANNASQRATKKKSVATEKDEQQSVRKRGAPRGNGNAKGNRGNVNASPPKRNSNAVTHGFFAKYLPEDTLEIMEAMQERSPADLIYDQIQIQYAAIIRAQQIMHVESKDETVKVLSKVKGLINDDDTIEFAEEKQYDYQFAWDRHATFLNAQSRAMSELRSLIKQFNDLAYEDDERRLKLEAMQVGIDKTKAELKDLQGDTSDDAHERMQQYMKAIGKADVTAVFNDE
ncbi:phage terminase small subunit [Sporosarcina soli]|uniref:Phage terminase small subunit n=1 Tax=Sporosarcina soli TaxID=334736 RepID=A0ABW0TDT2_9BACL